MKMKRFGCAFLSILVSVGSAWAGTINWTNTAGGTFSDAGNWESGVAPVPADSANFTNLGDYAVTLDADTVLSNLLVNADASVVTMDLAGYTLSPTNAFSVGSVSGRVAQAVVSNGVVITRALQVGANGSSGDLTYYGVSNRVSASGGLVIGQTGTGRVTFADAQSSLHATAGGSHYLAQNAGSFGELTVQGGRLNMTNSTLYCGSAGTGVINMQGGTGFVSVLYLGNTAGSKGVLTMSEPGAFMSAGLNLGNTAGADSEMYLSNGWFAARGETKFCISGRTLMMLNGGSITQDAGNTYMPHYAGTGVLVLASAESTFYLGGGFAIGQNTVGGRGEIYVTNGTVNTASISLGGTANSLASLTIYNGTTVVRNTTGNALTIASGINSTGSIVLGDARAMLVSSNTVTMLGNSGDGSLTISNGTALLKGLTVGNNTGSQGRVTIESGSLISPTNSVTIGASGSGRLTLAGPDAYLANIYGNSATVLGGNTGGSGFLYASNGTMVVRQLQVGGNGYGYAAIGMATVSVSDTVYIPNNSLVQQYANNADADIGYDGASYTVLVSTATNAWIGDVGGSTQRQVVLVLQLPSTRPANTLARGVSLSFRLSDVSAVARNFNVDLYGIRISTNSTVVTNDFAGGSLLQEDIMVPGTATGTLLTTSSAGSDALTAWLNGLYDAGAASGDYVFLGLRYDGTPDSQSYYQVHMANSALRANQPYLYIGFENGAEGMLVLNEAQSYLSVSNTLKVGGTAAVSSTGTVIVAKGTLNARIIEVGQVGYASLTLLDGTITGGTNSSTDGLRIGCSSSGGTGTVVLAHSNAFINLPDVQLTLGFAQNTASRLIVSNGSVLVRSVQMGGASNDKTNSVSEISIFDGSLTTTNITFQCGVGRSTTARILMGHPNAQLNHPNGTCFISFGTNSSASLIMSNGSFTAQSIQMGSNPTASPPGQYGEWIIYNATGTLRNVNGTGIWLAGQPNCTGLMVLAHAGAMVDCTNNVLVGDMGVGTLLVSNGLLTANNLSIGDKTGSVGRMEISGGRVEVSSQLTVANRGESVFRMSGGTLVATSFVVVGQIAATNIPATFELSGGTVQVSRLYALSAVGAQSNLWFSGGTLAARANFTNALTTTLTNSPGPGLFTFSTDFTNTQAGVLTGPGGLAKAGVGLLRLSQVNDYTGETVINAGTLALIGSATIANSTQITVAAGATLDASSPTFITVGGSQTIKGGGTVLGSLINDGTVAPGASPGTLSVVGDYLNNGTLALEIGGTTPGSEHDVLVVATNAIVGGTIKVTLVDGFTPATGNSFTVLTAMAVSGTFASTDLPSGDWSVDVQADQVVVNYTGSGGGSAEVSVSPTNLTFAATKVGEYSELTFMVTNSGDVQLDGTATVAAAGFTIQSGSPFSVAASGSASVTVRFTPTESGSYGGDVTFLSNGSSSINEVSGTGYVQASATNGAITLVSGHPTFGFTLASGALYRVQASTNLLNGSG